MDPDATVEVEILDVNDAEARAFLLAIDPLAQLAGYDADHLAKLRDITEKDSQAVTNLWSAIAESEKAARETGWCLMTPAGPVGLHDAGLFIPRNWNLSGRIVLWRPMGSRHEFGSFVG